MDLKGKNLVDWLRKQPNDKFPGGKSYVHRYDSVEEFLTQEVHPLVATGAALVDGIFLNDHGPRHIATVIQRASDLVAARACVLSPYEGYLLLAAIQVHDVGNIFGRKGHEKQHGQLEERLGNETIEKRMITKIAEAHGGSVDGDKDTIVRLEQNDTILGKPVRPRLLAALVRFADELADDRTRAARFAVEHGVVPENSLIFHKYSEALHSVIVDIKGQAIDLHFEISDADARLRFPKGAKQVYLLDEIIERTLKMHRERVYCTRFMRPEITLDSVNAKITVYAAPTAEAPYPAELKKIGYRLEDRGYPDSEYGVCDMCPELKTWHNGVPLSGDALVALLEDNRRET